MKQFTFDFDLSCWVKNVTIEAETLEEAQKKLMSMSVDEILNEGFVKDYNLKDVEVEMEEDDEEYVVTEFEDAAVDDKYIEDGRTVHTHVDLPISAEALDRFAGKLTPSDKVRVDLDITFNDHDAKSDDYQVSLGNIINSETHEVLIPAVDADIILTDTTGITSFSPEEVKAYIQNWAKELKDEWFSHIRELSTDYGQDEPEYDYDEE